MVPSTVLAAGGILSLHETSEWSCGLQAYMDIAGSLFWEHYPFKITYDIAVIRASHAGYYTCNNIIFSSQSVGLICWFNCQTCTQ